MSGNAWEWTRSLRGDYPYPNNPGELKKREALDAPLNEGRVLRGGGFHFDPWIVRCASRDGHLPAVCLKTIGFRVVVRPLL